MNIEIIFIVILVVFISCWIKYDEIIDYFEKIEKIKQEYNEEYDEEYKIKDSDDNHLEQKDYKNVNRQLKRDIYNYQFYLDYLKSDDWKMKKIQRFLIDNSQCQECNKLLSLKESHCHHKTYDNLFDEPMEDLETLCRYCHMEVRHADKCSNS